VSDDDYVRRVRACLLGGAIGDALGAGIEFDSLERIHRKYGGPVVGYVPAYGRTGAVTDDTQMTLFAVEGLVAGAADHAAGAARGDTAALSGLMGSVRDSYLRWFAGETQGTIPAGGWLPANPSLAASRAPGTTCVMGLRDGTGTRGRPANPHSKGCGTVMRAAPYGLLDGLPVPVRCQLAMDDAALTHGHPTAWAASAAMATMVAKLTAGQTLRAAAAEALDETVLTDEAGQEIAAALRVALSAPAASQPPAALGQGWVGDEALGIAVWCAVTASDPMAAMLAAVNHDGDSDSTGSLCGQLLGAGGGDAFLETLPAEWISGNEATELIPAVTHRLVTAWRSA
jgi:ADP-ribosylglycohydrolase